MSLTLREILDLAEVKAAAPALTTRQAGLNRAVTWAHSSEIFEIGPLLSGGELLLTTGLGLSGVDAGARRYWIRDLAERRVSAVAIEVGRSFATVPEELVDEADRSGMPLIRLDRVVPFERICRAVNTVLLNRESVAVRLADGLSDRLFATLAGGGLAAVARNAAEQIGRAVTVSTVAGRVVTAGGLTSPKALRRAVAETAARADIFVDGRPWGEVRIAADDGAGRSRAGSADAQPADARTDEAWPADVWTADALALAARRIAAAAAVAVAHLGDSSGEPGTAATPLLQDLVDGVPVAEQELVVRAGLAGLHPPAGAAVLGVVAHAREPAAGTALIRSAAATGGHGVLIGRVRGQLLGIVVAEAAAADPAGAFAERLRAGAERQDQDGAGETLTGAVGPPVPLADAGRSLREARAAAEYMRDGIRTWRETVADRLLGLLDDESRAHLVDDLLGSLRRWDAAHGSDLVRTVDVYLRYGCSPSRAAAELHLRRQSLHQRLNRAEQLLGFRLDDPASAAALLLAARAARADTHP
ncbi:helix-turn-helix domain-containing protein [Phytoactinopolyspora halotolerans]|uniref:PucR family transcriptional regulator n=1 Tax=Phytoactinopolyspora halotolerans TaxID=1981512 RepID=A0A6L9SBC2_9ACTN|nr:PucR family transcriptional regulator ligand-binding domain-containing protein [Phytoactinopolyspora halotolerans]NEE01808.1 PucR family transcriptional regulator [Phytoactinopolyspora halotolerans]